MKYQATDPRQARCRGRQRSIASVQTSICPFRSTPISGRSGTGAAGLQRAKNRKSSAELVGTYRRCQISALSSNNCIGGFSQITSWYKKRIDAVDPSGKDLSGAVIAIAKEGKLAYLQPIGFQDRAKTIPMTTDSIFWIASMTKPITSVAAMMLVDDGKLDLVASVAKYLPELKTMQVATAKPNRRQGKSKLR